MLNLHQGRLYHGSLPIPDDVPGLPAVVEIFESLTIESLVFQSSFSSKDAVALTEALSLRPSPDLDLAAELAARSVRSVTVSLLARTNEDEEVERDIEREKDRALFRKSVSSVRNMLEQVSAGDLSAVTEARSLAESLIPRLEEDAAAVLAMAAARRPSERQLYHSLNVMCYSLLLGHRLGLPGRGALFARHVCAASRHRQVRLRPRRCVAGGDDAPGAPACRRRDAPAARAR